MTDEVRERLAEVPGWVRDARATLADLDEPAVAVGVHCGAPYGCEFYAHCAPPAGQVFRARLGRQQGKACSSSCTRGTAICATCRKRSSRTTRSGSFGGSRGSGKRSSAPSCKTLARDAAVPALLLGLRDDRPGRADVRRHAAVRGAAVPMVVPHRDETAARSSTRSSCSSAPSRRCASSPSGLLATLGTSGPIVVYTPYERRVLNELAARYPDLAARLTAATERIVDLHPATRRGYYHPAMQGSWSIKAVLPTVAPDLSYAKLGEVQDGLAAQLAYLRGDRREDAAGAARGLGTVAARRTAGRTRWRWSGSWSSSRGIRLAGKPRPVRGLPCSAPACFAPRRAPARRHARVRRARPSRVRHRVRRGPRGRGQRRSHARLVAEPAHPLRRRDEDARRLDARAGRCCRPATCRPIGARTGPSRRSRSATRSRRRATSGATTRRSSTRPASTSARAPRKAASSAAARIPARSRRRRPIRTSTTP